MKETAITLTIGETKIPAVLNDSESAIGLKEILPHVIRLRRYDQDYCGTMPALCYNKNELRNGWSNGDLAFAADRNYFAILYKDEEISQQYSNMVTLGSLAVHSSVMEAFNDEIAVTINLQQP